MTRRNPCLEVTTLAQAARDYYRDPKDIKYYIDRDRLEWNKIGRTIVISRRSLRALFGSPKRAKKPKKPTGWVHLYKLDIKFCHFPHKRVFFAKNED